MKLSEKSLNIIQAAKSIAFDVESRTKKGSYIEAMSKKIQFDLESFHRTLLSCDELSSTPVHPTKAICS